MASDEIERSESGSPIYRHAPREKLWEPALHPAEHLEEIEAHVEKYIGKIETVYHEIVSDLIHLDVLFVPASDDRPYHVLVTSGVSDEPMTVPDGMEEWSRAELLLTLPSEWPLKQEDFKNRANYWPIGWLKMIGRMPHEYKTWIGWGHTIPNGNPAERIENTNFTGVILLPPYWLPTDFFQLKTQKQETINFYQLFPLYQEEMDFKLKNGSNELEKRFEENHIDHVLDIRRSNVAKKRGWFR